MKVLTVLPDIPLPADTGLHLRMLGNLECVRALGAESFLLCFSTEERIKNLRLMPEVQLLADEVIYAGQRKPQSEFTKAELARYKLGYLVAGRLGRPSASYPFAMRYDAVGACDLVAEEVARIGADYVVLPSSMIHWAPTLKRAGAQVVADAIDVLTDLTRRLMVDVSWGKPGQRLSLAANYYASRTQERLFLPECVEVWATSEGEVQRLRELSPSTRIVLIPNTVPEPDGDFARAELPRTVGFIGTYSSLPNARAARHLAEVIFPRVRAAVADSTLMLAGVGLSETDRVRYNGLPGTTVLGRVESSQQFVASCSVLALPIRIRGGVTLKLVESLALGRAVVASPEMIAGLPVSAGTDLVVGNTDDDFASAIVKLLEDDEYRSRIAANGRLAYERHFSRAALIKSAKADSILGEGV